MTRARFLILLPSLLFLLFSAKSVKAQASVYGTVALTDFGFTNYSSTTFKNDTAGFVAGMFYNFPIESRFTAGIDTRISQGFGTGGGTSVTAAFRAGFVPKRVVLRPYFQLGGGVVTSTRYPAGVIVLLPPGTFQPTRHTNGALQLAFGLDVRLTDSIDLRAAELGAAAGGGAGSSTGVGTAYLDAGIVYHFHRKKP
jgi:hypothetical protein